MTNPLPEDLISDLARLLDERAVMSTLYRYGHSIDYGLEEDWVGCFTEDGVFDVRRSGAEADSHRHEGRAALTEFVSRHTRAPNRYHKHMLVEPVVEISGDRASVHSYFTRLDAADDGTPFIRAFGRYVDELVREADGVWRFRERIAEVEGFAAGS